MRRCKHWRTRATRPVRLLQPPSSRSLLILDGCAEIAEGFRQQGNDLFKQRKFRDAIGFYTRAIDEVGKDLDLEERRTLWGNRAAANLELSTSPSLPSLSWTDRVRP